MDKDDKKPSASAPAASAPAKAAAPAPAVEKKEEEKAAPVKEEEAAPAELSAPTLTEGRVDELEHLRNEAGQLSPEDGAAPPDELSEYLKDKFSGEGRGTF